MHTKLTLYANYADFLSLAIRLMQGKISDRKPCTQLC